MSMNEKLKIKNLTLASFYVIISVEKWYTPLHNIIRKVIL